MFRDIRFVILTILLLISIYFLLIPLILKKSGVVVTLVEEGSRCGELKEGDTITQISGFSIRNKDDFEKAIRNIKAGEYVAMVIDGKPGGCVALADGNLGIEVKDIPSKQLKFGIDIQGGILTKLKPEKELTKNETEEIVKIIEKRIQTLGLQETKVYASENLINILSLEEFPQLTKKCEFEAKIQQELEIKNNSALLRIEENEYPIEFFDSKIKVNNFFYNLNESFYLENLKFKIENKTNTSALISALVFSNEDVERVLTQFSFLRYEQDFQNFVLDIPIEISSHASENFRKITSSIPATFVGGEMILNAELTYHLDGKLLNELSIPKKFVEEKIETISIVVFSEDSKELQRIKLELEACLTSGELPVKLEKIGESFIEPKYKLQEIFTLISLLILLPVPIIYLKNKNLKSGFFFSSILASEIILIFGITAFTQGFLTQGWILDLYSLIGIIAFICFGLAKVVLPTEKIKTSTLRNVTILLSVIAFVLLFSPWRGFGLSFLLGLIISSVLTRPLLKDLKSLTIYF